MAAFFPAPDQISRKWKDKGEGEGLNTISGLKISTIQLTDWAVKKVGTTATTVNRKIWIAQNQTPNRHLTGSASVKTIGLRTECHRFATESFMAHIMDFASQCVVSACARSAGIGGKERRGLFFLFCSSHLPRKKVFARGILWGTSSAGKRAKTRVRADGIGNSMPTV